tara:strand:- start:2520 stop:3029 length:510 start_codon:yes stop_codon:yes gene_type:complete
MANSYSNYNIIRVTPTLTEDSAYADGDVLFTATEIPNAVLGAGGCSKLLSCYLVDKDQSAFGVDLLFTEENTALGTIHATANISDADFKAIGLCGAMRHINTVAKSSDIDGLFVYKCMSLSESEESVEPILLQAKAGSTSVFVSGVINTGTPTFTNTDDIQLIFHIQYK